MGMCSHCEGSQERLCLRLLAANRISTGPSYAAFQARMYFNICPERWDISGWELPLEGSYLSFEAYIMFCRSVSIDD